MFAIRWCLLVMLVIATPGVASAADGDVRVTTSGGQSDDWTGRTYKSDDLWAYRPLRPAPRDIPRDRIVDELIDARLKQLDITTAAPADRRTLLRRATFDLTGLPPTPAEIAAFLKDSASDERAFARVVDRLLESPHYGEQWGRRWLDVVRYADSAGYANDYERGNAWRYRDYVVRSFNQDKPYDQFVREQLAGDEIDPNNPELLVAVGFLRMGPWELTGMEVAKVARQRYLDDVTDAVGQVFLGQLLQCARCHDHKFDPIPTRDFYSIQAVFATTQIAERPAEFLASEHRQGFDERKYLEQRREHYRKTLRELNEKSLAAARAWYADRKLDATNFEELVQAAASRPNIRDSEARYDEIRAALLRKGTPEDQVPPRHAGFAPRDFGLERVARKGLERLRWIVDRYEPVAHSVYNGRTPSLPGVYAPLRMPADRLTSGELETTCILYGGDPFSPREQVAPATLSALNSLAAPELGQIALPREIEGRRRALAAWITSAANPLTSRVIVNRVWQGHFGRPLAASPNNFGYTGKPPTHPELLDTLAAELTESGWSLKQLHRRIMNSQAYRRASRHPHGRQLAERDPTGTSYAAFPSRRLDAEEIRDAMLAVSGELNPSIGGVPCRPEIHPEAALQPRQVMGTFAEAWQPSPRPADRHRRSLYALRLRGLRDPLLEVFNAPSPDVSCEAREVSLVAPQVFALFNSQASYDRALAFARRLLASRETPEATVARAFELAFSRSPEPGETLACVAHWNAMTDRQRSLKFAKRDRPTSLVREAVEENTGEKFTFVEPLEMAAEFVPDFEAADADPETRGLADLCLVLLNANEFIYLD